MRKISVLICLVLFAFGCSSSPEAKYEIQNKQLHTKTTEQGERIFAYVVTVKASRLIHKKQPKAMSRSELKAFAKTNYFEESRQLKLQLEDDAANLLKQELTERKYCPSDYKIEQVLWRDLSVQLRGRCL